TGIGGRQGSRNAPSVINAAFLSRLFWDGRAASLEAQAQGPLTHPAEMGMADMAAVAARVRSLPAYDAGFRDAFGGPATATRIVRALAAFERTLVAADTPYDRFVRGDDGALTAQQVRGMALFDSVGCRSCHADPTFSAAGLVRPNGTYRVFPVFANDRARRHGLLVDGKAARWRVPSLRNVARTAPYFHTGSVADLEEAVRVMAVSQLRKVLSDDPAAAIAPARLETADGMETRLTLLPGRALSARDVKDIAAFLRALSGDPAGE
ncbi:MAG: c-type cytochrome, partial [Rhodobacterales bacterium]|nr:c-type cytochrome [Rhodobacterales bacterium]